MKDPDIERAKTLAANALHDSVTPERLTEKKRGVGRYRLHDDPVYRHLRADEQPQFLLYANKQTPTFNGPGAPPQLERSRRYQVIHLITDERWLMLAGNKDGDNTQEFPLAAIQATNYDISGNLPNTLTNNLFVVELASVHCSIPISNDFDTDDFDALSVYLRNEFGATREAVEVDSDEAGYTIAGSDSIQYDANDVRSRIDRLPDSAVDEANELVDEADSVEELIPRLDTLLEEHEDKTETLDDVVSEASSVQQVRRSVESPQERTARQAKELARGQVQSARSTLRDADPDSVGKWGINVGRATVPLAVAAPGSTPLWIAAMLTLGGAAGVHASGSEDSHLNDIDPEELTEHVLAMADSGRELDNIDGEVAGTLLGAFTYLGGRMAPDEFVKWIEAADPDAMLAGANAGAEYADRDDVEGDHLEGVLAGGGLGLLGGYAATDSEFDGTAGSADEIERYLSKLSEEGVTYDEED